MDMIFECESVTEFLNRELERRCSANPRYSMRAFAKALKLSPGELSEILRRKRALGARACQKVAQALELSPAEYKQLLMLSAASLGQGRDGVAAATAAPLIGTAAAWRSSERLSEDRFRLVSDWWCFAILSLLDLDGVDWSSVVIAERLGITRLQAQAAMERLLRLQLVRVTGAMKAVVTSDFVEHLSDVSSEAIRKYHRAVLEKAMAALEHQDTNERDITGIGFAVDRRDLKAIKREIAEFQDQIVAKYGKKRRGRTMDAVYQLEMALFALTTNLPTVAMTAGKRVLTAALTTMALLGALTVAPQGAWAGPTRVGNGDDGGDLENGKAVKSGVLIEARGEAVELLKKLNVGGIEGLGQLLPETEKAPLVLLERNIDLNKTNAAPEEKAAAEEEARAIGAVNDDGLPVYARTFPEPHAATRFFPAAMLLDRKQLVSLHIHEALHRALPKDLREDEKAVSRITLAIASGEATFDRVNDATQKELARIREAKQTAALSGAGGSGGRLSTTVEADDEPPMVKKPSILEYGYRSYIVPDPDKSLTPVKSLHSLKSFMYPFGRRAALGVGLEFTYLSIEQRSYLGPLGISGRLKLTTWREFDVDAFAALHMNTVAAGEIKNTPIGRDTGTIGLSMLRDERYYRVENQIYLTGGAEAKQKLGNVEYTHRFGSITAARVIAAGKVPLSNGSSLELGGSGEVLLADPYEVEGGAFKIKTERIRVVSVGPEVGVRFGDLKFAGYGRFVIDSTEGVTLDQLGDLMGHGVGQGSVGGSLSWRF